MAGSGFYPGLLVTDADGLLRPKSAVEHKQEVGTYSPHATPTAFSEQARSRPISLDLLALSSLDLPLSSSPSRSRPLPTRSTG